MSQARFKNYTCCSLELVTSQIFQLLSSSLSPFPSPLASSSSSSVDIHLALSYYFVTISLSRVKFGFLNIIWGLFDIHIYVFVCVCVFVCSVGDRERSLTLSIWWSWTSWQVAPSMISCSIRCSRSSWPITRPTSWTWDYLSTLGKGFVD